MKLRNDKRSGGHSGARDRDGRAQRVRPTRIEPSTFAWVDPLDDLEPVVVEKVVEKIVEKPVVYEKQVVVEKPVLVEKKVLVEKRVDKPVLVEKLVEREFSGGKSTGLKAALASRIAKPGAPASATAPTKTKAIIIGRGPSLAERLANLSPNPKPVLAGACALLIALFGIALISPSGDQATAQRASAPFGVTDASGESVPGDLSGDTATADTTINGEKRDPFAAQGYKSSDPAKNEKSSKKSGGKNSSGKKASADAPAVAKPSLYAANMITYSSYSPWLKVKRRSGGWIEFDGEPTLKVVSIAAGSVELYVVTDVEVLTDKSKKYSYSYPLRTVRLKPGGVVRFADYRDIQGEDVEYTVRFRGSEPVQTKSAQR